MVRVRAVRERDSRTGLATALAEERAAAARVTELQLEIETLRPLRSVDVATFHGHQHHIEVLRETLAAARESLEAHRQLATAARERWMADRTRLAAVEAIVERRLAAVRAERLRRENREQDEVATELWRRHGGAAS